MRVKVENQNIKILDSTMTVSGSENLYTVDFEFSEDWNGFSKTALFRLYGEEGGMPEFIVNDSCAISPHILQSKALAQIGVSGTTGGDDPVIKPTVWSDIFEVKEGAIAHSYPEPTPDYYAMVVEKVSEAYGYAQDAEEAKEAAEQALSKFVDVTVTAETLPSGSEATVEKTGGGDEPYNLNFGIPKGKDGEDGISPTITVTDITGGHEVTVTDASGTESFNVMDGTDADVTAEKIESALGYTPADEADLNEKIGEAPNDGKQYARQSNGWSEVIGVPYLSVVNGEVNITFEDGEE